MTQRDTIPRLLLAAPASGSGKTTVTCACCGRPGGGGFRPARSSAGRLYRPHVPPGGPGDAQPEPGFVLLRRGAGPRAPAGRPGQRPGGAGGRHGVLRRNRHDGPGQQLACGGGCGGPRPAGGPPPGDRPHPGGPAPGFGGVPLPQPDCRCVPQRLLRGPGPPPGPGAGAGGRTAGTGLSAPYAGVRPAQPPSGPVHTPGEIAGLRDKLERLADQLERTAALDRIFALARSAPPLEGEAPAPVREDPAGPAVAVARDEAFCFCYEDNLDELRRAGTRPVFFSPLRDGAPPPEACGLYLVGGYPELHAQALSENASMRRAVQGRLPAQYAHFSRVRRIFVPAGDPGGPGGPELAHGGGSGGGGQKDAPAPAVRLRRP